MRRTQDGQHRLHGAALAGGKTEYHSRVTTSTGALSVSAILSVMARERIYILDDEGKKVKN